MMLLMSQVLVFSGCVIGIVGGIWQYVEVFRFSKRWGFLCLCVPFAGFVFVMKYYQIVRKPFLVTMAGMGFILGVVAHSLL